MSRKRFWGVGACVVLLVAAACSKEEGGGGGGGAEETSAPSPALSPTVFSSGTTTVEIGGGNLPATWPEEFPLPDGATPVYSLATGGGAYVWFASPQGIDELRGFFDENLPANGWTVDSKQDFSDTSGAFSIYGITGNSFTGTVFLGEGSSVPGGFTGDFAFAVILDPATA